MGEEEIFKIDRKLQKMIDKSEVDESIARDLLIRLQESRITLALLQKTRIGITVNNLRRVSASEDLSTVAKGLLKNWKKLVPESSSLAPLNRDSRPETATATTSTNAIPTNSNSHPQSNESHITPGVTSKITKSTERKPTQAATPSRSSSASHMLDEVRLKSRDLLVSAISISELPDGSDDPVDLATRVEDAIFKEMKDTGVKYRNRIRSRISNLKDPKNPILRENFLRGLITPERLAVLTAAEMASEALKQERSKLNDMAINDYQLAIDEGKGTDLIQCRRCQQRNCAYTEVQTRSADEPMTLFVLCKNCGKRWKM